MNISVDTDYNTEDRQAGWQFFDGSIAVSVSMLIAALFSKCVFCENLLIISPLKSLVNQEDGIIIVATIILFPTTLALYGGWKMYFAAKQAYERRRRNWMRSLKEEGRVEGLAEGREEERERILSKLQQNGELTKDEIVRLISED